MKTWVQVPQRQPYLLRGVDLEKQLVLDLLEDSYATISIPYKSKLMEHYSTIKISHTQHNKYYHIESPSGYNHFGKFDNAWDAFSKFLNNVGIIQTRVRKAVEYELDEDIYLECDEHANVMMKHINNALFEIFARDECGHMNYSHPSGRKLCGTKKCDKSICKIWEDIDKNGEIAK